MKHNSTQSTVVVNMIARRVAPNSTNRGLNPDKDYYLHNLDYEYETE